MLLRSFRKIAVRCPRAPTNRICGKEVSSFLSTPEKNAIRDVHRMVADLCDLPLMEQSIPEFRGERFTSSLGEKAIQAIISPTTSSIAHVPVDKRSYAEKVFLRSLETPSPCMEGRRDLLCSVAFPGSGKTVLLWFNVYNFVEETGGIGIEVTFNNDQALLWNGGYNLMASSKEFEQAIAVRILHRVVEKMKSKSIADVAFQDDTPLVKAIVDLEDPLQNALAVVRLCLGALDDTKILLCVDEISKASENMETNLRVLAEHLDKHPNFFLAVSALQADSLLNLSMFPERRLLFQALGPLWSGGFDSEQIHLLPKLLQPFYDEKVRMTLPRETHHLQLYDEVANLLMTAAGHPRRLEVLFGELLEFERTRAVEKLFDCFGRLIEGQKYVDLFVSELATWLHRDVDMSGTLKTAAIDRITEKVRDIVPFPTDFSKLSTVSTIHLTNKEWEIVVADIVEKLAQYSACPFVMPSNVEDKEKLDTVLKGVARGFCQLVPAGHDNQKNQLLAYIPMPVLHGLLVVSASRLKPLGEALLKLQTAIHKMLNNRHAAQRDKREGLHDIATSSLLLFARCNETFSLSQLCDPTMCGSNLGVVLRGGPGVQYLTETRPPERYDEPLTASELQRHVDALSTSGAAGVIIQVHNQSSDSPNHLYGLFRTDSPDGGFVGFRIQLGTDWFPTEGILGPKSQIRHLVRDWRQCDHLYPSVVEMTDGTSIPFTSLLFSNTTFQRGGVEVENHEGIITLDKMRTWLPTTAHALQMVTHLHKVFGGGGGLEAKQLNKIFGGGFGEKK